MLLLRNSLKFFHRRFIFFSRFRLSTLLCVRTLALFSFRLCSLFSSWKMYYNYFVQIKKKLFVFFMKDEFSILLHVWYKDISWIYMLIIAIEYCNCTSRYLNLTLMALYNYIRRFWKVSNTDFINHIVGRDSQILYLWVDMSTDISQWLNVGLNKSNQMTRPTPQIYWLQKKKTSPCLYYNTAV